MKRRKNKPKQKRKVADTQTTDAPSAKRNLSRRDFLGNTAIYSVGAASIAGGGWYFANTIAVSAKESDLSMLGNGVPTVVQIHDPDCPTCNALRCEAREAVCAFEEEKLQFLVANLNTDEGRALANEHGVGKVTLLLFDGNGTKRLTLPGLNEAEHLKPVFERHIARYGTSASKT